jgi:hypothetical protein
MRVDGPIDLRSRVGSLPLQAGVDSGLYIAAKRRHIAEPLRDASARIERDRPNRNPPFVGSSTVACIVVTVPGAVMASSPSNPSRATF